MTLHDVRIQSSCATLAQTLAAYEASHPDSPKIELTTTSLAQAETKLKDKTGMHSAIGWLCLAWAKGEADLTRGGEVAVDNGLVEGWQPMGVGKFWRLCELSGMC